MGVEDEGSVGTRARAGHPRKVLVGCAVAVAYLVGTLALFRDPLVSRHYFWMQDFWIGGLLAFALLLFALRPMGFSPPSVSVSGRMAIAASLGLALLLWAGTYWIMLDYPLTRDELMAEFDAGIFAGGRLVQPLAPEWRPFATALAPAFLLEVPEARGWVSSYLPGHSFLRTTAAVLGDPALLNPLLAGLGLAASYDVVRRLFPDDRGAMWIVLAGYLLSAQVLVTAMTSYAMTAHLALNMVWLALFLRDRWWSHTAAMVVGIFASGLHQVVFHPLFAGPFLLALPFRGRWKLFAAYAAIYAAGLFWWIGYHGWAIDQAGMASGAAIHAGARGFLVDRVLPLLTQFHPGTIQFMMFNILRFLAWMPFFLLPLIVLAVPAIRRNNGQALPLAGGLVLTLVAMAVLLPYQGHGWGYRYLHGLIASVLLLAAYGYVEWRKRDHSGAARSVTALGLLTLAALPFLVWTSHAFVAPYAELSERVERQASDFVILETDPPGSAIDQVRNRADLTNRPLIFSSELLDLPMVQELCRRGTITVVDKSQFRLPQFGGDRGLETHFTRYREWLDGRDCLRSTSN